MSHASRDERQKSSCSYNANIVHLSFSDIVAALKSRHSISCEAKGFEPRLEGRFTAEPRAPGDLDRVPLPRGVKFKTAFITVKNTFLSTSAHLKLIIAPLLCAAIMRLKIPESCSLWSCCWRGTIKPERVSSLSCEIHKI